MKKYLKVGGIVLGSTVLVFSLLIFLVFSLPSSSNTEEGKVDYVKVTQDYSKKLNVSPTVKSKSDDFVNCFFHFDPEQLSKNSKYSLALSESKSLSQEYGQGEEIASQLIDATKDSYGNHHLTYQVRGNYHNKVKTFSLVLTASERSGEFSILNYSVVRHG